MKGKVEDNGLTHQQVDLKRKYTRIEEDVNGTYRAVFVSGGQVFTFASKQKRFEANWFCNMFAIALSKIQ